MATLNFKSKEAFQKWNSYGHVHKLFENTEGNQKILIKGRLYKVKHGER